MKSSWIVFPNSLRPTDNLFKLAAVFDQHLEEISSDEHTLESNAVLQILASDLESIGYSVEKGKKDEDKIRVPVLFGEHGAAMQSFLADAYHPEAHIVVEVEAGRAVANHQFLKDLFEACMMHDSEYLCIAVRKQYTSSGKRSLDYDKVCTFFRTLYASNRLQLPLKGVMVLGY